MPTIIILGLGAGDPALLTRAAWELLERATIIYTPVPDHPALAQVHPGRLHPLTDDDPTTTAMALIEYAAVSGEVVCALTGHPRDNPLIAAFQHVQPEYQPYTLQIIPGVSLIDAFCDALAIPSRGAGLQVVEIGALLFTPISTAHQSTPAWCEMQGIGPYIPPRVPYPLTPVQPALVWYRSSRQHATTSAETSTGAEQPPGDTLSAAPRPTFHTQLQQVLQLRYPPTHPLRLARIDQRGAALHVWDITLGDLCAETPLEATTAIYIPPLAAAANRRSLDGLEWVTMRLLGPDGCPWDREQTHQSLRTALLEETHEVLEALDAGDMSEMTEELGDLLLQVVVHSEMARQAGHFDLGTVLERIHTKLIRRHPHVFGNVSVDGTGEVVHNWEQIKAQELSEKGRQRANVLDGVPAGLPALATAQKFVTRAARAGFDWGMLPEVWGKLHEELEELAQACATDQSETSAAARAHVAEEFGDVLFAAVNLARWLSLDAESALREANTKFRRRFGYVEQCAREQGRSLQTLTIHEKYALWLQAKHAEQAEA